MWSGTPEPIDAAVYRSGPPGRWPSSQRPIQPELGIPVRMPLIQIAIELKWLRSAFG